MTLKILTRDTLTKAIQNQAHTLYQQLNATNKQQPLDDILQPNNNVLVVICLIDDTLIGMALLSTYKVISGYRGMIDDVVVDTAHRGKGIGRKLMEKILIEGKQMGLDEILLFSGHHRKPAITLYKSLGFTMRDSGLYTLKDF